jgi:hypothetical protein
MSKLSKRGREIARQLESIPDFLESRRRASSKQVIATVGWVTAGLGAVALGLIVGRELRHRYKFNHRTPYDFYAHAGDNAQDIEFGVGI